MSDDKITIDAKSVMVQLLENYTCCATEAEYWRRSVILCICESRQPTKPPVCVEMLAEICVSVGSEVDMLHRTATLKSSGMDQTVCEVHVRKDIDSQREIEWMLSHDGAACRLAIALVELSGDNNAARTIAQDAIVAYHRDICWLYEEEMSEMQDIAAAQKEINPNA